MLSSSSSSSSSLQPTPLYGSQINSSNKEQLLPLTPSNDVMAVLKRNRENILFGTSTLTGLVLTTLLSIGVLSGPIGWMALGVCLAISLFMSLSAAINPFVAINSQNIENLNERDESKCKEEIYLGINQLCASLSQSVSDVLKNASSDLGPLGAEDEDLRIMKEFELKKEHIESLSKMINPSNLTNEFCFMARCVMKEITKELALLRSFDDFDLDENLIGSTKKDIARKLTDLSNLSQPQLANPASIPASPHVSSLSSAAAAASLVATSVTDFSPGCPLELEEQIKRTANQGTSLLHPSPSPLSPITEYTAEAKAAEEDERKEDSTARIDLSSRLEFSSAGADSISRVTQVKSKEAMLEDLDNLLLGNVSDTFKDDLVNAFTVLDEEKISHVLHFLKDLLPMNVDRRILALNESIAVHKRVFGILEGNDRIDQEAAALIHSTRKTIAIAQEKNKDMLLAECLSVSRLLPNEFSIEEMTSQSTQAISLFQKSVEEFKNIPVIKVFFDVYGSFVLKVGEVESINKLNELLECIDVATVGELVNLHSRLEANSFMQLLEIISSLKSMSSLALVQGPKFEAFINSITANKIQMLTDVKQKLGKYGLFIFFGMFNHINVTQWDQTSSGAFKLTLDKLYLEDISGKDVAYPSQMKLNQEIEVTFSKNKKGESTVKFAPGSITCSSQYSWMIKGFGWFNFLGFSVDKDQAGLDDGDVSLLTVLPERLSPTIGVETALGYFDEMVSM